METETSILDTLRNEETPYWYLYDGKTLTARSGETSDIEASVNRLKTSLAELSAGTYRLKAANNPKKHNGAKWHDITISSRRAQPTPTHMNTHVTTNAHGIPDHIYKQIQEQAVQDFMFKDMYSDYKDFKPDMIKRVERLEKILLEDENGDGVPDFEQMAKTIGSAADTANTVKKVFTGSSLFD